MYSRSEHPSRAALARYDIGAGLPPELHEHITRTRPLLRIDANTIVHVWSGYTVVCTDMHVQLFPARWPVYIGKHITGPPPRDHARDIDGAAPFMLLTTTHSCERGRPSRAAVDELFTMPQLREQVRRGLHAWVQRFKHAITNYVNLVDLTHVLPRGLREIGQRIGMQRGAALFTPTTRLRVHTCARRRTRAHACDPAVMVILWNCHTRTCARMRMRGLHQESRVANVVQQTCVSSCDTILTWTGMVTSRLFCMHEPSKCDFVCTYTSTMLPVTYKCAQEVPAHIRDYVGGRAPDMCDTGVCVYSWRGCVVVYTDPTNTYANLGGTVRVYPRGWPLYFSRYARSPAWGMSVKDASAYPWRYHLLTTTRSTTSGTMSRMCARTLFMSGQLQRTHTRGLYAWVYSNVDQVVSVISLAHILPRGVRELGPRVNYTRESAVFMRRARVRQRRRRCINVGTAIIWHSYKRTSERVRTRNMCQVDEFGCVLCTNGYTLVSRAGTIRMLHGTARTK